MIKVIYNTLQSIDGEIRKAEKTGFWFAHNEFSFGIQQNGSGGYEATELSTGFLWSGCVAETVKGVVEKLIVAAEDQTKIDIVKKKIEGLKSLNIFPANEI